MKSTVFMYMISMRLVPSVFVGEVCGNGIIHYEHICTIAYKAVWVLLVRATDISAAEMSRTAELPLINHLHDGRDTYNPNDASFNQTQFTLPEMSLPSM